MTITDVSEDNAVGYDVPSLNPGPAHLSFWPGNDARNLLTAVGLLASGYLHAKCNHADLHIQGTGRSLGE